MSTARPPLRVQLEVAASGLNELGIARLFLALNAMGVVQGRLAFTLAYAECPPLFLEAEPVPNHLANDAAVFLLNRCHAAHRAGASLPHRVTVTADLRSV